MALATNNVCNTTLLHTKMVNGCAKLHWLITKNNPKKKYLLKIKSSDDLLRALIHDESNPNRDKKESFQLLHSAYVAGASHGLLLVGSKDSLIPAKRCGAIAVKRGFCSRKVLVNS